MSFAVRDFYLNGGRQAIIVRVYNPLFATEAAREAARTQAHNDAQAAANAVAAAAAAVPATGSAADVVTAARAAATGDPKTAARIASDGVIRAAETAAAAQGASVATVAAAAQSAVSAAVTAAENFIAPVTRARLSANGLNLEAAYEGAWGNKLWFRIDHDTKPVDANLFNLSVRDNASGRTETFRNVSIDATSPRWVKSVLERESLLVRILGAPPTAQPTKHDEPVPGADPFTAPSATGVTTPGSDGNEVGEGDFNGPNFQSGKKGIYALADADLFNILCIPPFTPSKDVTSALWSAAVQYCESRRAILIVDPPSTWNNKDQAKQGISTVGTTSNYAAIYFPRLRQPNPLKEGQVEDFAPCGAVAGVWSRIDTTRGVWKAPAGLEAVLNGVPDLSVPLTDDENGELNPLGVNCLRVKPPAGRVVWGARTLQGDDRLTSQWKYIPVRRTALFIEESLFRGTQYAVFEPNDEPLWSSLRINITSFLQGMFRQGAFQGRTPRDAYFVKVDNETTTQDDIDRGIVNIIVGFAPLKPAEFVVLKIQQITRQTQP
jgi:hypothetical protein